MSTEVGTYTVEDAFYIKPLGWALSGTLTGEARIGNQLAFPSGLVTCLKSMDYKILRNKQGEKQGEKWLFIIRAKFASQQELIDQHIIGATARVLE